MTDRATKKPSTGPKTAIGKSRVKFNALKHGIFVQILFDGGKFEVAAQQFDDLVKDLRQAIRPTNGLEA